MRAVELAVMNSPSGKTVIAHVGAYSLSEALRLARHAASVGVHAISSLPPLGSYTFAEIRGYYESLASAVDVPLFVYYFPELCPAITHPGQLLQLAAIPNVAGLKFTDFNLYRLWEIRREGKIVYDGRDEVLAGGLLLGADGGIGTFYNLVPDWFIDVYRAARAGDWTRARAIQNDINELIQVVLRFPPLPAVKLPTFPHGPGLRGMSATSRPPHRTRGKEPAVGSRVHPVCTRAAGHEGRRMTGSRSAWILVGVLWGVAALNYLDRQVIFSVFPPLRADLKLSDIQLGLVTTAFLWVYGAFSPIAGYIADRFGRSRAITASLLVWSAVTWATGEARAFAQLLSARALMGLSEACYLPAALALISDRHGPATRSPQVFTSGGFTRA